MLNSKRPWQSKSDWAGGQFACLRGRPGWEWVAAMWPKYEALTVLAPASSAVPVAVSAAGCATLRATLAPHSVMLWEIS